MPLILDEILKDKNYKASEVADNSPLASDPLGKQYQDRLDIEAKQNATIFAEDDAMAFGKQFKKSNIVGAGVTKLNQVILDSRFEDDKNFSDNYDSNMKLNDLAVNGLDSGRYFNRLDEAKSEGHRQAIIQELKASRDDDIFINEHLSSGSQMTASATGAIIDIDTVLIGPASMMIKSRSLAKVAGLSAGLESAGIAAKASMDDSYDIRQQGFADLVIGTLMNTGIAKLSNMKQLSSDIKASPTNDTLMIEYKIKQPYSIDQIEGTDFYSKGTNVTTMREALDASKSIARNLGEKEATEFMRGYEDAVKVRDLEAKTLEKDNRVIARQKEIDTLEQSMIVTKGKNKGTPKKMSKVKQDAINIKIQNLKNDNILEDTLTMEQKLDQIKKAEIEAKYGYKQTDEVMLEQWRRESQSRIDKEKDLVKKKDLYDQELINLQKKADDYKDSMDRKRKTELDEARFKELERKMERDKNIKVMKENSTGLKFFYKQQDDLLEQASKEANAVKAQKEITKIKEFEDLVHSLGDTVAKSLSRLGRRLEAKTINIEDANKAVDLLKNKFPNHTKLFNSLDKYFKKHRSSDIAKGGVMLDDIVAQTKGLSKMQKAGLVSFLLFAPAAIFADDGRGEDGISTGQALLYTLLSLGAMKLIVPHIYNGLKNNSLKESMTDLGKDIKRNASDKHYMISGKGKGLAKMIGDLHKGLSTGFNSSYKGLMAKIDKKIKDPVQAKFAKDLLRKLLFNPLDGTLQTFDSVKKQMIKEVLDKPNLWYKQEYGNFAKTQRTNWLGRALDEIEIQSMFNQKVADMLDGRIPIEKEFKNTVESTRKMFKQALDDAVEAGVLGAEEARRLAKENYFPRIWKFTELKNILNRLDKNAEGFSEGRNAMIKGLAKGMSGKDVEKKAELLLDWIQTSDFKSKSKNSDNMINEIDDFLSKNDIDLLKDDAKLFELKRMIQGDVGKSGRLQARLELDWSKVEFPEVSIDGVKKTLNIEDFVNRDVRDVTSMYANDLYSKIYLRKIGYDSVSELRDTIAKNIHDTEISDNLNMAINILLNKPLQGDGTVAMQQLVELGKGLAFVMAMPLVAFSMATEIAKTIGNAGFGRTLKALQHQIGRLDKDSLEFSLLENTSGLGTSNNASRYDFRGIEQGAADDVATWAITRGMRKAQQMVAKGSGLIDLGDITQKANYLAHVHEFANLVNGNKHKLMSKRLDSYGIDDKTTAMFQNKFKFNKEGNLTNFDKHTWSLDERTKFNDVMLRLNQEMTPEVMLGTQGLWMRTSLGKIASFLLSYPMNVFENQGVKDFHYMDMRTVSNTVITFGSSYLGMVAKYEAMDRDYEPETLMAYAFMNLPSMGGLSAMNAITEGGSIFNIVGGLSDNVKAELKSDVQLLVK